MVSLTDKSKQLMNEILPDLLAGKDTPAKKAERLFEALFTGSLTMAQAKSVLLLLAAKGETADELWGAVCALKKLEKPIGPRIHGLMDTCGTGGDKSRSINISTLAAFIVAGAGIKIAKHGNRAISSRSGSSDLMEAFGIKLDATPAQMFKSIRHAGIGYFHAPFYHPVFAKLHPLRRKLKRRTLLNLLGPLVNPMKLDYQLVGVANKQLLPLYAKVLAKLGRKSALVCHSSDGMDEISTANPTHVAWIKNGAVRQGQISPKGLGLKRATRSNLCVANPKQCHQIALKILSGKEKGPKRDAVIINAACAILLTGKTHSLKEAVQIAIRSLDSGNAFTAMKTLKKMTS